MESDTKSISSSYLFVFCIKKWKPPYFYSKWEISVIRIEVKKNYLFFFPASVKSLIDFSIFMPSHHREQNRHTKRIHYNARRGKEARKPQPRKLQCEILCVQTNPPSLNIKFIFFCCFINGNNKTSPCQHN
jgi:hypothetical protein